MSNTKGFDELTARLGKMAERLPQAIRQALYEEAQKVATASKRLTPVEWSNLKDSTDASLAVDAGELAAKVTVGGVAAPYAWYVHEDLTAHHDVGQAKFLHTAGKEAEVGWDERMGRRIASALMQ
jgi:hypothetical protein